MKSFSCLAAAVVLSAILGLPAAQAATTIYSTNFDEFNPNFTLTGAGQGRGWVTNDEYNPATDRGETTIVTSISGGSATDYYAFLGGNPGFPPGSPQVSVWRPFSTAGILTGAPDAGALHFTTLSAISQSTLGMPNHDDFGYSFRNAAGTELFALSLRYKAASNVYELVFKEGAKAPITGSLAIPLNSTYRFSFDGYLAGNSSDLLNLAVTDGFGTTYNIFDKITLADGLVSQIGQIAAVWNILNTGTDAQGNLNAYGGNRMVIGEYGISVIPEPASVALLSAGAALLAVRRRRVRP